MNKNDKVYEPPKMKVYQFDESDQVLTFSGETPTADYAARALNELMGGTNTTIEK